MEAICQLLTKIIHNSKFPHAHKLIRDCAFNALLNAYTMACRREESSREVEMEWEVHLKKRN